MANNGRPTLLDEKVAKTIIDLVRAGNFMETACCAAGVDPRTVRRWMREGAKGVEPYAKFADDVTEAIAKSESDDVLRIGLAGRKDWKALAWRLERKNPKMWGFRVRVEVKEEIDAFLDRLKNALSPELYEQVLIVASDELGASALGGDQPGEEPEPSTH